MQEKTTPSTHISRLLGGKKLQTMLTQQAQRDKKRTILVYDEECYHKFKG